jgi:3-isopropylmalate dehydrogenase
VKDLATRTERLEAASKQTTTATITLLPGDGVGPEVIAAARLVLDAVASRSRLHFRYEDALIGGAAIDVTGLPLPDETLRKCLAADAVLLGAVGGPQWNDLTGRIQPEQGLFGIRKALGVFANLRPVRPDAAVTAISPVKAEILAGVDLLVVRELTGGLYFGEKTLTQHGSGERATDLCVYTTAEIERIVRVAGELARGRRGKVTSVDKANVLESSRLWRRVATRVFRDEFPDLVVDHLLVDTAAMQLIRAPASFDVIVTENMFGDILTDEAAVLAGSIGLLPSASLGAIDANAATRRGLYEPIHGSAPTIAGKGIANPIGAILSVALMLRYSFNLEHEARSIETAVEAVLASGVRTPDIALPGVRTISTMELAAAVSARL